MLSAIWVRPDSERRSGLAKGRRSRRHSGRASSELDALVLAYATTIHKQTES
jgi:hypothetical protein